MKTKEELNALKVEYENLGKKLSELTEDELNVVTGGTLPPICPDERFVMTTDGEKVIPINIVGGPTSSET